MQKFFCQMERRFKVNKKKKEVRSFSNFQLRDLDNADSQEVVGVPVVFNHPTCLYEYDGIKYYEVIDRHAFDECDMSDVVFNYNHGGHIAARTRNKTLELKKNDSQLEMVAFLGGTSYGKELLEEIRGGYVDKMSFAFEVDVDGSVYDKNTHTRTITKIKKLYDVSAVDFPAYDSTSISARSFFNEQIQHEKEEFVKERKRKKILIKTKL